MDELEEAILKAVIANTEVGIIAQERSQNSVEYTIIQALVDGANSSVSSIGDMVE